MRGMLWMVAVVVTVMVVSTYVTWITGRVERLHVRASAAYNALDAHLVRRAVAAVALAEATQLPSLMYAARVALDTPAEDREAAENDLTRQLREIVVLEDPVFVDVVAANRRVALARQLHTDVVRDALRVRRRFTVRCLRLGHRFAVPAYFDIDDPNLDLRIVSQRAPSDPQVVDTEPPVEPVSDVDAATTG